MPTTDRDMKGSALMPTILIVDNSEDLRILLTDTLQDAGWTVQTAADGSQALALIHTDPPTLLLTDLSMPVMSGETLIHHTQHLYPALPIVVMTGSIARAETDTIRQRLNVQGVLAKPFDLRTLKTLLSSLVQAAPTKSTAA